MKWGNKREEGKREEPAQREEIPPVDAKVFLKAEDAPSELEKAPGEVPEEVPEEAFPRMSAEQYFNFRNKLLKVDNAKLNMELIKTKSVLMQRDMELAALRHKMFVMTEYRQVAEDQKIKQHEYSSFINELEKELGFSLTNKVVDDVTFEIKEAPEVKKP